MVRRKPRMFRPTVDNPWVDLPDWVGRLKMSIDDNEVNLICQNTGLVVYTTPSYAWGNRIATGSITRVKSPGAAKQRALNWMRRHGFRINLVDHNFYTRR